MNLDFVGDPAECDTTNANIYLYDASPIVSYNGNVVSGMFSENIADPHKFRPLTDPCVGIDGFYLHANSGEFTTPDSALGLTVDYWTPGAFSFVSGATWRAVYVRVMYWNNTDAPIDSVFCAYGLDWDVPSDSGAKNYSAISANVFTEPYVYQRGVEFGTDIGNPACRDNSTRYAATIYWPPSSAGENPHTDSGNGVMGAGFQWLYTRDNASYISDDWDHAALDSLLHITVGIFIFDPPNGAAVNLHTVLNSGAYRIDPDDTLAQWLILLTGFGTQEEFEEKISSAFDP